MSAEGSSSLPDRPEAITPAWLSEALQASLPGVEVARVGIADQHSGTTGRARLRLGYAAGSTGPETVFVKLPPFDEAQRQLVAATEMGRREARFYESLAAEVPVRVPRPYYAGHHEGVCDLWDEGETTLIHGERRRYRLGVRGPAR